jgi:single-strand DNA-binding protein
MLNVSALTGRLAENPELRVTQSGIPYISTRIAVQRDYTKDGERETDFFTVTAWRATAEFICKYFAKGDLITVSGRLQNRSWTDKHEQRRVTTELIIDRAYFAESKKRDNANEYAGGYGEYAGGNSGEYTSGNANGYSGEYAAENTGAVYDPADNAAAPDFGEFDDELPF